MKKNILTKQGMTLIETLIYVAIFSIFIVALASFAININSSRISGQIIFDVNDQGSQVINVITQSLRNASTTTIPAIGTSSSTLSITTTVPAQNPTIFSLINGVLYIKEGANNSVALTNNKVTVSNLVFSDLSQPLKPKTVQIRFKISNSASSTKPEEQYSLNFYGSGSLRK